MRWKALQVVAVLTLGVHLAVPSAVVPAPEHGVVEGGWSATFAGPGIAIVLYGLLGCVALFKALNHLPGVFALRQRLGHVDSGHGHLWFPAIFASMASLEWSGTYDVTEHGLRTWKLQYGQAADPNVSLAAFGAFVFMMLALKLRAAMIEANRRLPAREPASVS